MVLASPSMNADPMPKIGKRKRIGMWLNFVGRTRPWVQSSISAKINIQTKNLNENHHLKIRPDRRNTIKDGRGGWRILAFR
jgi:hypothetical protein